MNKEFDFITEEDWAKFLTEIHADPDYWCDYVPEDFGFKIKENKNEKKI